MVTGVKGGRGSGGVGGVTHVHTRTDEGQGSEIWALIWFLFVILLPL